MRELIGGRVGSGRSVLALCSCAAWVVLLAAPSGSSNGEPRSEPLAVDAGSPGLLNLSSVTLTLAPSDWWMASGNSTTVSGRWSGIPPGCALNPLWFQWSVGTGGAEGLLDPTQGETVNFTALAVTSGPTLVEVRAAAEMTCGSEAAAAFRNATATFHVDVPLSLGALSLEPNPAPAGVPVGLEGLIAGGEAPYSVMVDWNGGNVTRTTVATSGPFTISEPLAPGTYDPTVVVTDAAGLVAEAAVPEAVTVSDDFAVGLDASSYTAEVGVPVRFTIESTFAPANYSSVAACEDASDAFDPAIVPGINFSCAFAEPGIANVSVYAVDANFPYDEASAYLYEKVVPPLTLTLPTLETTGEVGRPTYVPLLLAGGVPPFQVSWRFVGNGTAGAVTAPADGTLLIPAIPSVPGSEELVVRAIDAMGVPTEDVSATIGVVPSLSVDALAEGTIVGTTPELGIGATVLSGAGPFDWVVVPGEENEPVGGGSLASLGSLVWNASGQAEGSLSAVLGIVDAVGAVQEIPLAATPALPLSILLQTVSVVPGRWSGSVVVEDGIPPYLIWMNDSAGDTWNGTASAQGPFNLTEAPRASGALLLSVTVVDGFGRSALVRSWVDVPPVPLPTATAPLLAWDGLGAAIAAAIVGIAIVLWRRGRGGARETPLKEDPAQTVRSILEPADGADRATVELLAEEEGIPLETVHSTIDRLIQEGTVRAERGPDGEEILAWRDGR